MRPGVPLAGMLLYAQKRRFPQQGAGASLCARVITIAPGTAPE